MLEALLRTLKVPEPVREFKFDEKRKWRFDYAWPDHKVALEVEGGIWNQGRHNRGSGFIKDIEKYNAAGGLGWRGFRTTPDALLTTQTIEMLRNVLTR